MTHQSGKSSGARGPRVGTLAWLSQLAAQEGLEAAIRELKKYIPEQSSEPYSMIRPSEGQRIWRTDVHGTHDDDDIVYESFSPPTLWGVPYSVLKASFSHEESDHLMFHRGEELLIPTSGRVNYRFHSWTEKEDESALRDDVTVDSGSIIRINPQLPHNTWALGDNCEGASAWMIFRDASDAPTSIGIDPSLHSGQFDHEPDTEARRTSPSELSNPVEYALTAWGIAESIRLQRERSDLNIKKLAEFTGVDPAQISRLENRDRKANLSLDALVRIAQFLGLPLPQVINEAGWQFEMEEFDQVAQSDKAVPIFNKEKTKGEEERLPNFLHLRVISLSEGYAHPEEYNGALEEGYYRSWIVNSGRMIVTLNVEEETEKSEVVGADTVMHFRESCISEIEVLEPARIVQISYSTK